MKETAVWRRSMRTAPNPYSGVPGCRQRARERNKFSETLLKDPEVT